MKERLTFPLCLAINLRECLSYTILVQAQANGNESSNNVSGVNHNWRLKTIVFMLAGGDAEKLNKCIKFLMNDFGRYEGT